ncbi:MAG: hypothetical protein BMS9Abin05_0431 [Rhodothermia bacterium]|nr:MAG: hypothetical protein BMS9Abin05_0431 [Rhodothermia bacterium]
MSYGYFRRGISTAVRRPALAGLLYGVNLVIGLLVTVPIYLALNSATATTGYSSDLATQFDIVLWVDVMEDTRPVLTGLLFQLFWIFPLILLWKAVASVGVICTLHTQGLRSFWQGIGEYAGRAILLAVTFLVPIAALFIGIVVSFFILSAVWPGEVGAYWINLVFLPVSLVAGLALLDLMHDYARMELVIGKKKVLESILKGFSWPFRHFKSVGLYVVWFVIALLLLAIPTIIDVRPGGLWAVFAVQQLFLFGRAGVTVGWFGSEIDLYDSALTAELPAIARVEAEPRLAEEN